jgi:hypothetical protein
MGTVYHRSRSIRQGGGGFEVTVFELGRRLPSRERWVLHARVSYLPVEGNATRLTNDVELEPSSTLGAILASLAALGSRLPSPRTSTS